MHEKFTASRGISGFEERVYIRTIDFGRFLGITQVFLMVLYFVLAENPVKDRRGIFTLIIKYFGIMHIFHQIAEILSN